MMLDLQKASVLKRASAFLLDIILLFVLITGFAFALFSITGYDDYAARLEEKEKVYEEQYGVSFNVTEKEYNELTEEARATLDAAYEAFGKEEEVLYLYNMQLNLILMLSTVSILLAHGKAVSDADLTCLQINTATTVRSRIAINGEAFVGGF